MGSITFYGPFGVLRIRTWEASIGGYSVVAWWGPGSEIFGVRRSHIWELICPAGICCNYI